MNNIQHPHQHPKQLLRKIAQKAFISSDFHCNRKYEVFPSQIEEGGGREEHFGGCRIAELCVLLHSNELPTVLHSFIGSHRAAFILPSVQDRNIEAHVMSNTKFYVQNMYFLKAKLCK